MNRVCKAVFSEAVHKQGILGKGIGIAIVDTGLFPHPDYRSRITGWYDALYQKPAPYDDNGHGSHVAGIAAGAGTFSHGKYKGIAPQANLIGVKVLNSKGNGTIHDIMNGLQWILKNQERLKIRIVNISIGTNDRHAYPEDSAFVRKVNQLWDAGIIVVAAAGNQGPDPQTISAPGNSRKIITVGSYDFAERTDVIPSSHSGAGPYVFLHQKTGRRCARFSYYQLLPSRQNKRLFLLKEKRHLHVHTNCERCHCPAFK